MSNELVKLEAPANELARLGELMTAAISNNVSAETIERLTAVYERMADRKAAQEFHEALDKFQSECPQIPRGSKAEVVTRSGAKYGYTYASLEEVDAVVRPIAHRHGLSYTWDQEVHGEIMSVTCRLSHVGGHGTTAKATGPVDSSAGMSAMQKFTAAGTTLKRLSLISVLGLTTTDKDTDGAVPGGDKPISPDAASVVNQLLAESGADVARFCKHFRIASVAELRVADYETAVRTLKEKRDRR